jgi:hypothetical protein
MKFFKLICEQLKRYPAGLSLILFFLPPAAGFLEDVIFLQNRLEKNFNPALYQRLFPPNEKK